MKVPGQSKLAGAHGADLPGLPRGRGRLPEDVVKDAQNQRLMRAVVSAVAEKGYAEVTVADIVQRARVSRKVFYEHFGHKRDCFLAAARGGAALIFARLTAAVEAVEPEQRLAAAVRAYLQVAVEEPEFIRCLGIEIYAIGDVGLRFRREIVERFAPLFRAFAIGDDLSDGVESADLAPRDYAALAAMAEMIIAYSLDGKVKQIPELEDDIVSIVRLLYAGSAINNAH